MGRNPSALVPAASFPGSALSTHRSAFSYKPSAVGRKPMARSARGWDVANNAGLTEVYKPVIHEESIKVAGATKASDYTFRIGGRRVFFAEAQKPAVRIAEDASPAFHIRLGDEKRKSRAGLRTQQSGSVMRSFMLDSNEPVKTEETP